MRGRDQPRGRDAVDTKHVEERPRDRVTHPEWRHAITGSRLVQPVYWAKILENSYGCWGMFVHW
jgi:hypothetical protein